MKYLLAIILFVLFMVCTLAESRSEVCVDLNTSASLILQEVSPKIEDYSKTWTIDGDNELFAKNIMKIIEERKKDVPLLHQVEINILFLDNNEGKIIYVLQIIFMLYDLNEMTDYKDSLNFIIMKNFILLVKEKQIFDSSNSKVEI